VSELTGAVTDNEKERIMADSNEHLEWELERYREADRERTDREIEEARRREQDRKDDYEIRRRTADNWEEALRKQATLLRHEAKDEPYDPNDPNDYFFTEGTQACERALILWKEAEQKVQPDIEELEKRIDALRESIRQSVVANLLLEDQRPGWKSLAFSLRESSLGNFLDW
jgi:hypothetical protein